MNYLRGYTFKCLCGRQVVGTYSITAEEFNSQTENGLAPIDKKRAICTEMRGVPAGKGVLTTKSAAPHDVGCGRTLAEVDRVL